MRILRALRDELASFLEGQEHGICVLHGERDRLPFVYRILLELEGGSGDVFLCFPHVFASADDYVRLIADRVEASRREAGGDPAWSLPAPCRDPGRPALARLQEVLGCARAMLPRGSEAPRLVVVLCPLETQDEPGRRALCEALVHAPAGAPPWFRRLRVIVDAPAPPASAPRFVRSLRVDLSPEALAASARADADDPARSREERAQASLQVAMLDLGHRRLEAARVRLDQVYGEAQALGSPQLAAQALCGLGDVERVAGEREAAIAWYERALVPAAEARAPVVLLTLSRHLADLYFASRRPRDAETFYDGAQQLAAALPEPETQARALLGRGLAQQQRGAPAQEWAASFLAAGEVARDNDRADLLAELRPLLTASRREPLPAELQRGIAGLLGGGA